MDITIEQAKAFDAVVRAGTLQRAAQSLNKGHSAVMYLIKSLETQVGFDLFDRSNYRNQVTQEGKIILRFCQKLIETQEDLKAACQKMHTGWEPSFQLIYDAVIDFQEITQALSHIQDEQTPTEVRVLPAYLDEVEEQFKKLRADIMVTIVPIQCDNTVAIHLKPINMYLVAHKNHGLHQKLTTLHKKRGGKRTLCCEDLQAHTYIQLKEVSPRLGLSTEDVKFNSAFYVNDFGTKKQALMNGLGFGWLPEYSIIKELKAGELKILNMEAGLKNKHILRPRLYHRQEEVLGKAALKFLEHFSS